MTNHKEDNTQRLDDVFFGIDIDPNVVLSLIEARKNSQNTVLDFPKTNVKPAAETSEAQLEDIYFG